MINKVILLGNIGADPEVRTLENGVKTAKFRLATSENIQNKQTKEWEQRVEWHNVVLWRNFADTADKYAHKGSQVYVEGVLHYREWQDREGQRHFTTEITATEFKLLGKIAKETSVSPEPTFAPPQYPVPSPATSQPVVPTPMPTQEVMPANSVDDIPDDLPF